MGIPARLLRAVLAGLGWTVLGLAALAGLALSAGVLLAASKVGRPVVASSLIRIADEAVAGHLELEGIAVLSSGGVELRGLRVIDPDGHLVLEVDRAQVFADVTRLRNRVIGLRVEVEGASVLLEEEAGGGVSIARAFAPARPSPAPGARAPRGELGSGWRLRVQRLTVRRSEIWWVDAAGATRLEAQGVDADARGVLGPDRSRAELQLRGHLYAPVAAPVSLDVRAALDGRALRVPVLRAVVGDTAVEGLGVADLAERTGRVALSRVEADPAQVRALLPRAELGGRLTASAYADSDGAVATAAVLLAPVDGGAAGRGEAAAAARVSGARALGLDLVLDRLDPSRVHARAPRGELTLTARGGAAGADLETLRGRVAVDLKRSSLRGGEVGPGTLVARADRGRWDVQRLALAAPGLEVQGSGAWRPAGPVSGKVSVDGRDLARAARNLEALLGTRLPPLGGRGTVAGTLGGTAAAPVLDASVEAPQVRVGGLTFAGTRGEARLSGPVRAVTAAVKATVSRLGIDGREVARGLELQGDLTRSEARVEARAAVPAAGREPLTLHALATRTARPDELLLTELTLAYPGTRYALVGPTRATLSAPRVDRLELASGAQRIVLEGGVGERSALDARLVVEALRLEGLPEGLLPAGEALAGELSGDLRASGTARRPVVAGHLAVAGGRWRGLEGLRAVADGRWDGATRRAALTLAAERAAGGTAGLALDLPVPLGGRPGEPVSARVDGEALPLELILAAARVDLDASGTFALHARLSGTAGAPALEAQAALEGAAYQDLSAIGLTVAAEVPGERLQAKVEARLSGEPVLRASGELPLDLADLLASPADTLRRARTAPVTADAELLGLELALLADRVAAVPEGAAGRLTGRARLEGTPAAPRGQAALALEGGALGGYSGLSATVSVAAAGEQVTAEARASLRGEEVLQASGSLGAPPERLATAAGLRAAPIALQAVVPRVALARTSPAEVPLEGTVEGRLTVEGTLGAPRLAFEGEGKGLAVEGKLLGDVTSRGKWAGASGEAGITLAAAAGGTLDASLRVEAPPSVALRAAQLRSAPAVIAVRARALGLGFLPAVAPGLVRAASGTLEADVEARGPLAKPVPRGTAKLTDGRLAVSEYGDWTGIVVDAAVTEDAVELTRITAGRGRGSLEGRASLRGIARGEGKLEGRLTTAQLPIMRGGEDLATLDLQVDVAGSYRPGELKVDLTLPRGTVRLPDRPPRTLQSLEGRADITVGPVRKRRALAVAPPGAEGPLTITVHAVVPGRLAVVSDNPRIRVDLKGDVTWELEGATQTAEGTVEVVRGDVEPIGGRNFQVERGKVTFTGGPPRAAVLDVEAVYENQLAGVKVTAAVTGPLSKPELRLTSEPPLDEGQIALLLATGRTEFKAGGGGVGTISGEEAGRAALGAVATQMFRNLVAGKLPLDTVAVDSSTLRAGKYVSDRIYVAYTRRFDVQLDQGQNQNEIQVQYQITSRWMLESRYGDAQSGGASLIWSKSY